MAMQYISHSDATERLARIQRVRQGIENNKAESSVRLTRLTSNIDKGKGHVFNYQEPDEDKGPYKLLRISSNNETDDVSSFSSHSTSSAPNLISTGFRIGPSSEGRVSGNQSQGKTQMRPHSWKRKLTSRSPTIASEQAGISSTSPSQMAMKRKPTLPLMLTKAGLQDVIKECWGSREELQNNTKERINRCRRGIL
ncbi:hypothetical protein IGI04_023439, partial [Brassica rapa subsp. trilocularis]